MATQREDPEVSEAVPTVVKPKLSIVVVLAMLLGILLSITAAGAYSYFRQSSVLQKEALTAKASLREKSLAVEEMKTQIEALSKQMYQLKEYSVAHSSELSEKKTEKVPPCVAPETPKATAGKESANVPAGPAAVQTVKKPKPDPQNNCELVGKSAEEQAATLKRCVKLMDSGGQSR